MLANGYTRVEQGRFSKDSILQQICTDRLLTISYICNCFVDTCISTPLKLRLFGALRRLRLLFFLTLGTYDPEGDEKLRK